MFFPPQRIPTMKTTIKLNPSRLRAIGLTLASLLSAEMGLMAEEKAKNSPQLTLEPLSITVLKDPGDDPDQGRNSFNMLSSAPTSGTKLLVRVTPAAGLKAKLVDSGAKLAVFQDDKKKNLLEGGEKTRQRPSLFGPSNEKLTVLPGRGDEDNSFGLAINAPIIPSAGATKLMISGTLVFAPEDIEKREARHSKLILKDGEIVNVGPVRLKFAKSKRGRMPWFVQMIAEKHAVSPTLMLFGEDVDRVIFDSERGSGFTSMGGKRDMKNPFSGVIANGFNCPGDKISRIKVRYYKQGDLIEIPFEFKTGLGLQGTR